MFRKILVFVICLFYGLARAQTVEPIKPPEIIGGPPVMFPADFDWSLQIGKTLPEFQKRFAVGPAGKWIDHDVDRQPLSEIVFHHSGSEVELTGTQVSDIHRQTVYEPVYQLEDNDPYVKGLPVHSGHTIVRDGKPVETFCGYHHLIYRDGTVTTELLTIIQINERWWVVHIGWHCGNWPANCRSLGICFIGNLDNHPPSDAQIKAGKGLIAYYRSLVPNLVVSRHNQYKNTNCPGTTWPQWWPSLVE